MRLLAQLWDGFSQKRRSLSQGGARCVLAVGPVPVLSRGAWAPDALPETNLKPLPPWKQKFSFR